MPPRSPSSDASIGELAWVFFSPRGRISREPYWLGLGVVFFLLATIASVMVRTAVIETGPDGDMVLRMDEQGTLLEILAFGLQWVMIALVAKRCHDRGLTGFLSLLTMLPLISIPFVIFMGIGAGQPGPNRYGPAPNSRPPRRGPSGPSDRPD
ncbi:DUF805 domain-containing protein [Breoghania sp. L-A4]|uniref:DUF805 domain-containing protein n=1 Tax=Breoghania sp. L-A4 TaxID=2304600 RepID=UPI000E35FB31|nr:DUF805 domain-containing protein [Breoghania sp. L-A4]AXS39116.1 DUF805 domain-containing protein [Breoghania sp. L-A4]